MAAPGSGMVLRRPATPRSRTVAASHPSLGETALIHRDTEKTQLVVGGVDFNVETRLLRQHSAYFQVKLREQWKTNATTLETPELADVSSVSFQMFEVWLLRGVILTEREPGSTPSAFNFKEICKAYILGEIILARDFQNHLIDIFEYKVDANDGMRMDLPKLVYDNTPPDSSLQRLLVDVYALRQSPLILRSDRAKPHLTQQFLVDLAVAQYQFSDGSRHVPASFSPSVLRCHYHNHEEYGSNHCWVAQRSVQPNSADTDDLHLRVHMGAIDQGNATNRDNTELAIVGNENAAGRSSTSRDSTELAVQENNAAFEASDGTLTDEASQNTVGHDSHTVPGTPTAIKEEAGPVDSAMSIGIHRLPIIEYTSDVDEDEIDQMLSSKKRKLDDTEGSHQKAKTGTQGTANEAVGHKRKVYRFSKKRQAKMLKHGQTADDSIALDD